jgi:hypothetical protein
MISEMSILVGPGRPEFLKDLLPPGTAITPGDTKLGWDRSKPEEVEAVKTAFDKLLAKGYTAFRVGLAGGKGDKLTTWDPAAEKIIMVPRISGGR